MRKGKIIVLVIALAALLFLLGLPLYWRLFPAKPPVPGPERYAFDDLIRGLDTEKAVWSLEEGGKTVTAAAAEKKAVCEKLFWELGKRLTRETSRPEEAVPAWEAFRGSMEKKYAGEDRIILTEVTGQDGPSLILAGNGKGCTMAVWLDGKSYLFEKEDPEMAAALKAAFAAE